MHVKHLFDVAKDGAVLRVHVQPGAGRDAVIGIHGDALKVRTSAPPVSGKANDAVFSLLARELDVDVATMELTAGATGRIKRVKFTGVDEDDFESKLRVALDSAGEGHGPKKR